MFAVLIYDVAGERTGVYRKIGRKYLNHVQNSVLFGDITESKFIKMKSEIAKKVEIGDNIQLISAENRNNILVEIISRDSSLGPAIISEDNLHKSDYSVI